jgi:hypothetical protein
LNKNYSIVAIFKDQDKYLGKWIFVLPWNEHGINHKRRCKIFTFVTIIISPIKVIKELTFSRPLIAFGGISVFIDLNYPNSNYLYRIDKGVHFIRISFVSGSDLPRTNFGFLYQETISWVFSVLFDNLYFLTSVKLASVFKSILLCILKYLSP